MTPKRLALRIALQKISMNNANEIASSWDSSGNNCDNNFGNDQITNIDIFNEESDGEVDIAYTNQDDNDSSSDSESESLEEDSTKSDYV